MAFKFAKTVLFAALCVWLTACSNVAQQTKSTSSEPKITEEDITEGRSGQPRTEEQVQSPAFSGPAAPPVEEAPPNVDSGTRQPRRFIWRDRKGSGKSWESDEGTAGREP